MKTLAVAEPTNKSSLSTILRRIDKFLGNEFTSWIQVGIDLGAIKRDRLFEQDGYKTFAEMIDVLYTQSGVFGIKEADRRIKMGDIILEIRKLGDIPEPTSGAQIRPLLAYDPMKAARIWEKLVPKIEATGASPTRELVTDFIQNNIREIEATVTQTPPIPARSWEKPQEEEQEPQDIDFSDETPAKVFPESATICLNRIEAYEKAGVFPPGSRKAIEDEILIVDNNDLNAWNNYEDPDFVRIGRLVFRRRWTVTSSYRFIAKKIKSGSSLEDLVSTAIANGGHHVEIIDDFRIDCRPVVK